MWKFMAEYGNGRANSTCYATGESCTYGKTVSKIVDPISQNDHPGHSRHGIGDLMAMTMTVAMAMTLINNNACC